MLERARQQRLPHACLLYGRSGMGKHDFARSFAAALLCEQPGSDGTACGHCASCRRVENGTHADLFHIVPAPPKNSTSKQPVLSIRVDAIRELIEDLNHTANYGGYRVAIIEDADLMQVSAANSLLKTLEEPGEAVVILLVSSNPSRLPVTIRSRCAQIRFDTPASDEVVAWLEQQGVQEAATVLKMVDGAPLHALEQREEGHEQQRLLSRIFCARVSGEDAHALIPELTGIPKRDALDWLLIWTSDLIRYMCDGRKENIVNRRYLVQLDKLAHRCDLRTLFGFYDMLSQERRNTAIALDVQLFWENLLISWDDV